MEPRRRESPGSADQRAGYGRFPAMSDRPLSKTRLDRSDSLNIIRIFGSRSKPRLLPVPPAGVSVDSSINHLSMEGRPVS